jgi:hypothetical protein
MNSTRIHSDEAMSIILAMAMNRLATCEDFRSGFLETVKMTEALIAHEGRSPARWVPMGVRRWKAFCAVAPAILARGDGAWKTFQIAHLSKIEDDGEAMMLIALWCERVDPSEAIETFTEKAETGELDENEYVRQCDIAKVVHSIRERNERLRQRTMAEIPNLNGFVETHRRR